jgi:hypothetical protein
MEADNKLKKLEDFPRVKILSFEKRNMYDLESKLSQVDEYLSDKVAHLIGSEKVQSYLHSLCKIVGKTINTNEFMSLIETGKDIYLSGDEDSFDILFAEGNKKGDFYLANKEHPDFPKIMEPIAKIKYQGRDSSLMQKISNYFRNK